MEDFEQLYITLRNSNLTNKSFKEFVQLYEDDDYKLRVHNAVVDKGLYISDFNKFTSDYALPTVEVKVDEKVEEAKGPSTISEAILSQIPVTPITKLATNIWDGLTDSYERIKTTIVSDDEKAKFQFNKELKDIDESVLTSEWIQERKDDFSSNGRDMENLLTKIKIAHSRRIFGMSNKKYELTMEDLDNGFERFKQYYCSKENKLPFPSHLYT